MPALLLAPEHTRHEHRSATKLNALVLDALLAAGLPAVHLPPFPLWRKRAGRRTARTARAGVRHVRELLRAGLMPVMHGDSVVDEVDGCGILSGDALLEVLCRALRPKLAVFLTDVPGVFSRPPSEPGAELIAEIHVDRNASTAKAPCVQQPVRPPSAPEARPLAQGYPLGPSRGPLPRGCRCEAAPVRWMPAQHRRSRGLRPSRKRRALVPRRVGGLWRSRHLVERRGARRERRPRCQARERGRHRRRGRARLHRAGGDAACGGGARRPMARGVHSRCEPEVRSKPINQSV